MGINVIHIALYVNYKYLYVNLLTFHKGGALHGSAKCAP